MTYSALLIDSLLVQPGDGALERVVRAVKWRPAGHAQGAVTRLPDPDPSTFVPFEEVDPELVRSWIGEEEIARVMTSLAEQWQAPPWSSP